MELTLDIFRNDAFSAVNLQRTIDLMPYVPNQLGQLGIFESTPLDQEVVLLYEKDGGYQLIPTTERGTPFTQQLRRQGRLRALNTVAIRKQDTVRAGELMGVANMAIPDTIRLRNAIDLQNERVAQLLSDMEATKELHRLGALQGKLIDADGSTVIANFYAQNGISDAPMVSIDFSTLAEADLAGYFDLNFVQPMLNVLGGRAGPGTRVAALVGAGFWNRLTAHPGFYNIWKASITGAGGGNFMSVVNGQPSLANGFTRGDWAQAQPIEFANILWIPYRASTSGDIAIGFNDARFFPLGAKDVFKAYWAPGETIGDVQQKGKPQYLYIQPDVRTQMAMYVDFFVACYPLYACIFPKALMWARKTG